MKPKPNPWQHVADNPLSVACRGRKFPISHEAPKASSVDTVAEAQSALLAKIYSYSPESLSTTAFQSSPSQSAHPPIAPWIALKAS